MLAGISRPLPGSTSSTHPTLDMSTMGIVGTGLVVVSILLAETSLRSFFHFVLVKHDSSLGIVEDSPAQLSFVLASHNVIACFKEVIEITNQPNRQIVAPCTHKSVRLQTGPKALEWAHHGVPRRASWKVRRCFRWIATLLKVQILYCM